jgi:hypothetical protein
LNSANPVGVATYALLKGLEIFSSLETSIGVPMVTGALKEPDSLISAWPAHSQIWNLDLPLSIWMDVLIALNTSTAQLEQAIGTHLNALMELTVQLGHPSLCFAHPGSSARTSTVEFR